MIGYLALLRFYSTTALTRHGETGMPLAVHDGKRVLCCCAPAESLGLRVGMSLTEARALGHGVTFVRYVPAEYLETSHVWLTLCLQATPKIEVGEPHEAWLDLSGHPCPEDVLDRLAGVLLAELGWSVRVGLAECKWIAKLVAKVASASSRIAVPNPACAPLYPTLLPSGEEGFTACSNEATSASTSVTLRHDEPPATRDPRSTTRDFLPPLPVRALPIESQIAERLEFLGYRTIGALRKASLSVLKSQFGKEGVRLAHLARGGSDGALVPNFPPDALTAERVLEGGCEDREGFAVALSELASELNTGLVDRDAEGRTLMLWLELESGRVLGCERTFARSLRRADSLRLSLGMLLDGLELDEPAMRLRVMMPSLMKAGQGQAAFELMLSVDDKKSRAERALRHVRSVFGEASVLPAGEVPVERRVQVLRIWRESNGWR